MGKKVLVIPMQNQYEQQCNALGAKAMGATVIKTLDEAYHPAIADWIAHGKNLKVDYPNITDKIIEKLMHEHAPNFKKKPEATVGLVV